MLITPRHSRSRYFRMTLHDFNSHPDLIPLTEGRSPRVAGRRNARIFPQTAGTNGMPCQQTLRQAVTVEGRGYFSGEQVTIQLQPATVNTGIVFVRVDCAPKVRIPARVDFRIDDLRRTSIARNGVRVEMIEHVMAALAAMGVDNCEIWIDRPEVPAGDGSARAATAAIVEAGLRPQAAPAKVLQLRETMRVGTDENWIEASPAEDDSWHVRYELDYSHAPAIGRQTFQAAVVPEHFQSEIAPARSFLLLEEAEWLRNQGLGTHVTHQDVLVFDDRGPLENELRFPDECVRHKLLDLIGDLSLCGQRVQGKFVACRSGHQLNGQLARELVAASSAAKRRCSA